MRWYSTRRNHQGDRRRVGEVLRIYGTVNDYALVKPDKGNGKYQFIALSRLTKIEAINA